MRQGHLVGDSIERPQIFGLLGEHAPEQPVGDEAGRSAFSLALSISGCAILFRPTAEG
ncbi:MAG TPA: hypothetical protein VN178_11795 [Rubrobacter sp.]|nr:hypothetical protein [Rubrobacter sp.]